MITSFRTAVITILVLIGPPLQADNSEFQQILDNYVNAVNELDMTLASTIWSHQDDVSFIHPRGHQHGWEEIRDHFYLGAMASFSKRDLRLKNVAVYPLSETTAWAEFYWDFDAIFKADGTPMSSAGRESQIWRKEADGWKIVHVHYSGPALEGEREGF